MVRRALMLLSNEYRPDPRVEKEAEALVQAGVEMTVLAWDRGRSRPIMEEQKGVLIKRIRTFSAGSKRSFVLSYPFFVMKAIAKALTQDAELVHAHDLDTLFIGVMVSRIKGVPLVYDAHEHYAKMVEADLPASICRLMDRGEYYLARRADKIIAANTKIAEYLEEGSGRKPVVVMNCIDTPEEKVPKVRSDGLTIFYGGSLEPLRYILEVAQAVKGMDNISLRIAGTGTLETELKMLAKDDDRVRMLGYLPRESIMKEIQGADLVIALLDPIIENNRIGTPNRLFEAMAVGTPVLVSAGTLSGSIVEEEKCGYSIQWSEAELKKVVKQLSDAGERDKLGENGLRAVKDRYNWSLMKQRLIDVYRSL